MVSLNKYIYYTLLLSCIAFINGCAQKTTVNALRAPALKNNSVRYIVVKPVTHDTMGQRAEIISAMSAVKVGNEPYFHIADRENLNGIMKEKAYSSQGLSDDGEIGSAPLLKATSILNGAIVGNDITESRYTEQRTDYNSCVEWKKDGDGKKKYCQKYRVYSVPCLSKRYRLSTSIRITTLKSAQTIFSKTYTHSFEKSRCSDEKHVLYSQHEAAGHLAESIAAALVKDIAPSYVSFDVVVLEDPYIEYTDEQENLLENALELVKQHRIEKAKIVFSMLVSSTKSKSIVALYNLGVMQEALGEYEEAYKNYERAETLSFQIEIVPEVSQAVDRTKKHMAEQTLIRRTLM